MPISKFARRAGTLVVAACALAIASAAIATPANAHSVLLATKPTDTGVVTAPISEVTLTFNERVHGDFTTVVVNGPRPGGSGSVSYSDGHVQVIDDVVHQKVYPLRSGDYQVSWRAISADGHPVEGQFGFKVALPANEEPQAGPPVP